MTPIEMFHIIHTRYNAVLLDHIITRLVTIISTPVWEQTDDSQVHEGTLEEIFIWRR